MKTERLVLGISTGTSLGGIEELPFAVFEFSEHEMTVSLGASCPDDKRCVSPLWDHTAYELEKLSVGLRFVAEGRLPQYYEVPSRDMLIGPLVGLDPALTFQIGHPGFGRPGRGTNISCSTRYSAKHRKRFVDLAGLFEDHAAYARIEVQDAIEFSEMLYPVAKKLASRFIRDE